MSHWSLDSIAWEKFDRSKVRPELLSLAKAACMVEHNGQDYARYLCEVFTDDPEFQQAAKYWAEEEVQHGEALRKWVQLADPEFDFGKSFGAFTEGYKLPVNVNASVRGSRSGELIARCVVETGTSNYYTAIMEYSDEPVLKEVCGHIAADEFRHYKLFYGHLKRYLEKENIGLFKRLKVAAGRVIESNDDELAYAFFAAQMSKDANSLTAKDYDRKKYSKLYFAAVCRIYRKPHVQRMASMIAKAAGINPQGWLGRGCGQVAWTFMRMSAARA